MRALYISYEGAVKEINIAGSITSIKKELKADRLMEYEIFNGIVAFADKDEVLNMDKRNAIANDIYEQYFYLDYDGNHDPMKEGEPFVQIVGDAIFMSTDEFFGDPAGLSDEELNMIINA